MRLPSGVLSKTVAIMACRLLAEHDLNMFRNGQCRAIPRPLRGGAVGDCDSERFKISDVTFEDVESTVATYVVTVMQCSAAAGDCGGIDIETVLVDDVRVLTDEYLCSYAEEPVGFECTGDGADNPGAS